LSISQTVSKKNPQHIALLPASVLKWALQFVYSNILEKLRNDGVIVILQMFS